MFKITIVACGNKMPNWVNAAVNEYSKRLQEHLQLTWVEIPLIKRAKSASLSRIIDKETALMKATIPEGARVIALAIAGKSYNSEQLAHKFATLQHTVNHLCILIGGPEGLSKETINRADENWSLSPLTLPHPLVRILLIEALYRAWSINQNHPYHK